MQSIPETDKLTRDEFLNQVLPSNKPLVIRGLIKHWPIVNAALDGDEAFCNYLRRFDCGYDLDTVTGPSSIQGRIFYNLDMSGINCRTNKMKLDASLNFLLQQGREQPAPLIAIQSSVIERCLPGMQLENTLPLAPPQAQPRIWIGNQSTVAAHYDPSENIACCVAGKRRFKLLPPEQVSNLYIGPFELTPSGPTISMVDFNAPDYEKFPLFRTAEENMLTADLFPGDCIYIPYLWWHHVQAMAPINALINYWWSIETEMLADPRGALLHSIMSLRNLPPNYRQAWKAQFDHYVFNESDANQHIPEERQGVLGKPNADLLKVLRMSLSKSLSRN